MKQRWSIGLIMIKPHAVRGGVDKILQDFLLGKPTELDNELLFPTRFLKDIRENIVLFKTVEWDLGDKSSASKALFEIFYGHQKDKKFYKPLAKILSGPVIFFVIVLKGNRNYLNKTLKKLKGKAPLIWKGVLTHGTGIRGYFLNPRLQLPDKYVANLSEREYEQVIKGVFNNVVHTSDSMRETVATLRHIFNSDDFQSLQNRYPELHTQIIKNTSK